MTFEEIKSYAEARYEEAEKRLDEAIRNYQAFDIQFWRGYRECAQRMTEVLQ